MDSLLNKLCIGEGSLASCLILHYTDKREEALHNYSLPKG